MAAKSPVDITDPTLSLAVFINGSPIKDYYPVISVMVSHEVNRISFAEVTLIDGDLKNSSFPLSDSNDFVPGAEIEIKAGYTSVPSESLFKGYIVRQGIQINDDFGSNMVLNCKHKAVTMTFNKTEAQFSKLADSAIMAQIIQKYGLSSTVKATSPVQETVFQKLATDWDFILSRAEFYGYIITLDGDAITIGTPKTDAAAVLRVAMGESVRSFSAFLNSEKQATGIEASAWDIKNQALIKTNASEPSVNGQGNLNGKSLSGKLGQSKLLLNSGIPMVQEELKAWADGTLLKMRMAAIKGSVSFIGNASVLPGKIIELAGVGDRFNGKAFVTAVEHQIDNGNWNTTVQFGLDNLPIYEKADFSYPQASGQLPPIHGLQVGTVKKLVDDPEGQYRILVNLISNAEQQDGIWARQANFYATSDFGAGFLPEVGDEVVIGFLENNPRYPIILGSLYSNARKTAFAAKDDNNYLKALSTKSNLKISFDDEKKVTRIETPAGNMITLSDDAKSVEIIDQNKNTFKMNSSGISLNSPKDITIEATGNLSLNATGKISLAAKQDVAVSGLNVENTANVSFSAKGNATAELSASGQTTVKGAIVMIN
jgi:Rhs element Vgr protein